LESIISDVVLETFPQSINVLVVGGSGGIGEAVLSQLLASNQVNTLCNWSRSEILLKDPKLHHCRIDYADESTIENAAQQLTTPLDLVIITTGFLHNSSAQKTIRPEKSFKQINPNSFHQNMLVNVLGPTLIAKHVLPLMNTTHKTAVSYTHLRAHETVLDLVCRLLLEKKKKT